MSLSQNGTWDIFDVGLQHIHHKSAKFCHVSESLLMLVADDTLLEACSARLWRCFCGRSGVTTGKDDPEFQSAWLAWIFFYVVTSTYEVSRDGWLLMTCEVWRLLRLEVIEAATMFTSCLDVQWWWSEGCAGLKKLEPEGSSVRIPKPTTSQHLLSQRCKLKKKPGKPLRRGNRAGAPVDFPWRLSMSWQRGDLPTLRHVERWRRRWDENPVGWNSADTTWRISWI